MGERLVREVEAAGREGLAWLLGVASLRREALSRVAQVHAWVAAVETQRGEARDEAAAAEARCDELEQQVARSKGDVRASCDVIEDVQRAAAKLAQREQVVHAEVVMLRAEVERLRAAGGAA